MCQKCVKRSPFQCHPALGPYRPMVPKLAVDTDATLAAEGVPGGKPEDPPEAGNPKPMTELGVGGGRLSLSPGVK